MFDWISNIRVSAKLSLGFGLVLGLALLLASTGWYAIATLTERGVKIEKIAQISDYTKELRINRLRLGANPQPDAYQPLQKILDNLAAHLQSISTQFTAPIDQELIQQQNTSVREYGRLLLDLAKPNADQGPNINVWGSWVICCSIRRKNSLIRKIPSAMPTPRLPRFCWGSSLP